MLLNKKEMAEITWPSIAFDYQVPEFDFTTLDVRQKKTPVQSADYVDLSQEEGPFSHPYRWMVVGWALPPNCVHSLLTLRAFGVTEEECRSQIPLLAAYDNETLGAVMPMAVVPLFHFVQFPPDADLHFRLLAEDETIADQARTWQKTQAEVASAVITKEEIDAFGQREGVRTVDIHSIPPPSTVREFTRALIVQILPPQSEKPLFKIRGIFRTNADACAYAYALRRMDSDSKGLMLSTFTFGVGQWQEFPIIPGQISTPVKMTESAQEEQEREKRTRKRREEIEQAKFAAQHTQIQISLARRRAAKMLAKQKKYEENGDLRAEKELWLSEMQTAENVTQGSALAVADAPFQKWKARGLERIAEIDALLAQGIEFQPKEKPKEEPKPEEPKPEEPKPEEPKPEEPKPEEPKKEEPKKKKRPSRSEHMRRMRAGVVGKSTQEGPSEQEIRSREISHHYDRMRAQEEIRMQKAAARQGSAPLDRLRRKVAFPVALDQAREKKMKEMAAKQTKENVEG